MIKNVLKSVSLRIIAILILSSLIVSSCGKDESIDSETTITLTTISGNELSMNGIWSSGCVEANNDMILSESLTFNNENLQIDINGYDNMHCKGATIFNELVVITFNNSGTTTVIFNGEEVLVNKIDGTASYTDGRVEDFKQLFFIDDTSGEKYMHHAIFENDGGQVDSEGYPIEIIPISIIKTS